MTALTRAGGNKASLPTGVQVAEVNYDEEASIVSALRGQEFLVITLSVRAPQDLHSKIVQAAAKAGVPFIMPNAFGSDIRNLALCKEDLYGSGSIAKCEEIEKSGAAYVAMVCGFWYEWSLALGEGCYGIDIKNKKATFFDDGQARINTSTWDQCGRALAGLLSLPEGGATPSLEQWKNEPLYISSFRVSQREMLDSVHRVMGTTDADWTITHQPSGERYKEALDELKKGVRTGFTKAMYTRIFFPNGGGDFEFSNELANKALSLPEESLDEATKTAVEMVESGWNPFA